MVIIYLAYTHQIIRCFGCTSVEHVCGLILLERINCRSPCSLGTLSRLGFYSPIMGCFEYTDLSNTVAESLFSPDVLAYAMFSVFSVRLALYRFLMYVGMLSFVENCTQLLNLMTCRITRTILQEKTSYVEFCIACCLLFELVSCYMI